MSVPLSARQYATRLVRALEAGYRAARPGDHPPLDLHALEADIAAAWQALEALDEVPGDAPGVEGAKVHLAAYATFVGLLRQTLTREEATS